jgi:hypothetical protein
MNTAHRSTGALPGVVTLDAWKAAYAFSVANALLFLLLSVGAVLTHIESIGFSNGTCLVFFVGSMLGFLGLVRAGGAAASISLYVLGTGLLFGFGTYYSTLSTDPIYQLYFPPSQQEVMLPIINLVNALSVFIVLMTAAPLCWQGPGNAKSLDSISKAMGALQPLLPIAAMVAIPYIFVLYATFPRPSNLLVRGAMNNVQGFVLFGVVIAGARWRETPPAIRMVSIAAVIAMSLFGLVGFSKLRVILPFLSLLIGMALNPRYRRMAMLLGLVLAAFYALVAAPLVNRSRNDTYYLPDNTISDQVQVLIRTAENAGTTKQRARQSGTLLQRISAAPFQAFLIESYDRGAPGNSMKDAWVAAVPRVFWRDKPDVTRFGMEFDNLFFRRAHEESALAPTYTAESYWNFGWAGLVLGSLVIGLELGWLTRKWNLLAREGIKHAGVLVFAVPVALLGVWVENWFAATYIGGFATLVVLIKLFDYAVPRFVGAAPAEPKRIRRFLRASS